MRLICLFVLSLMAGAAHAQSSLATNNSALAENAQSACMQNANRLLDEAFTLMQKHYYRKEYIEWDTLRNAAKQKLNSTSNCEDAYETITWCFQQMKEKHSFIMPTVKAMEYNNDVELKSTPSLNSLMGPMQATILQDSIGYILVPWISTTDETICTQIADSMQTQIASLESRGAKSWIIDIRNNKGGNCWPMIAGIGPLIGEGVCGYFIKNEDRVSISYKNGTALQGRVARCVTNRKYVLKNAAPKIAVLTNNTTSSSGEILTLAFKGKANVSSFGEPTAGFTTANATYTLSDKSMLVLTVCQEADRTGKIYNGRIIPDVTVASVPNADVIRQAAIEWLNK